MLLYPRESFHCLITTVPGVRQRPQILDIVFSTTMIWRKGPLFTWVNDLPSLHEYGPRLFVQYLEKRHGLVSGYRYYYYCLTLATEQHNAFFSNFEIFYHFLLLWKEKNSSYHYNDGSNGNAPNDKRVRLDKVPELVITSLQTNVTFITVITALKHASCL